MKQLFRVLMTLGITCTIGLSCTNEWDKHYTQDKSASAYELLKDEKSASDFFSLLEQYELSYLLKGGAVTVLAPTNGTIHTEQMSSDEVRALLRRHIVSGLLSSGIASGKTYFTSNGCTVRFDANFTTVNGVRIEQMLKNESGGIIYNIATPMSSSRETLYSFLKKNKETYSYLFSLYDNVEFDKEASVKLVDDNGKIYYDSIFIAKSSFLDPYINNSIDYTFGLFTDEQFDAAVASKPEALKKIVDSNKDVKTGLIVKTLLQSVFEGRKNVPAAGTKWEAVNGYQATITPSQIEKRFDYRSFGNVFYYTELSGNLATNYFTLLIQAETYTLSGNEGASGGANQNAQVKVPLFNSKGNGLAKRSWGTNSHLFYYIGGVQKGTYIPVLSGLEYKVRIGVWLNKVINCKFWVFNASGDKQLKGSEGDPNFDVNGCFINTVLEDRMREIEFPATTLYVGSTQQFKFHIDYRTSSGVSLPMIGTTPAAADDQGFVLDYIEFEPVF